MYKMGWVLTFVTAGVVYFALIKIRPPKVFPTGFDDVPVTWEYLVAEGRDGFFDGERDEHAEFSPHESVADGVTSMDEKPKGVY